ncbi:MAG: DmsE family decaheme c-type cytochrome [Thermoanaerobaculales bacterium]
MTTWLRVLGAVSVPTLLATAALAGAAPPKPADAFAPCSTCHEEFTTAFATSPHARLSPADCSSCHGDGAKHAVEGDKAFITVPKGAAGARVCLTCHGGKKDFTHAGTGAHATASVYCTDCHSVHAPAATNVALLRALPGNECLTCHPAQTKEFSKPFAHHLGKGALTCFSCHNPHGAAGEKNLKETTAGEVVCLSCHGEKRGPFVFQHVNGVTGNCLSCHEPHGSNNPKRLIRARVDRLCLECHTTLPAGNLGSQPPSFHDLRSPRYQNCTVCHMAIHGSNSSPMLLK